MVFFMVSGGRELIQAARSYAEQRGLELDTVICVMEDTIKTSESRHYNYSKIVVKINRDSGNVELFKEVLVNENSSVLFDGDYQCMGILEARKINPSIKVGDVLLDSLPVADPCRGDVFFSKNIFLKKLGEQVAEKQYNDLIKSKGEIVVCIVKRVLERGIAVDLNGIESLIFNSDLVFGDSYRVGDRVSACLLDVLRGNSGIIIKLSRAHKDFVKQVLKREIPEVYDGTICVEAVSRTRFKSKVAVSSRDSRVDPVGTCIGIKGSRIQSVINELNGEKIDIVQYSNDPIKFVVNALSITEVIRVVIDEKNNSMNVVVSDNQLSLAIGKGGQNVRLASELVGWELNIISAKDESERKMDEINQKSDSIMAALDVEKIIAQFLIVEGFDSVEAIANSSVESLENIECFDREIASAIFERASEYIKNTSSGKDQENSVPDTKYTTDKDEENNEDEKETLKIADDTFIPLNVADLLLENNISDIEDLADLSNHELKKIVGDTIDDDKIDKIIMHCREKSGWLN